MADNPFQFGRELGIEELVNRKKELELIAQTIENSNKLFLIGNRRYGKTSLLKTASDAAEKKGHLIFRYNAEGYPTLDALVKTIIRDAAAKLGGTVEKAGQSIKSFFGSLRPEINFSVSQTEWKIGLGVAASAKPEEQISLLIEVLHGLERLAENQPPEQRVALVIDEFQEIIEVGGRVAEKQIRAAIQEHKRVAYIFSGSKTRLLTDMTTNKSRPFYRLGQNLFVKALPRDEFRQFLLNSFGNGGFQVDGATDAERGRNGGCIEEILEFAQDVPYNVQMLAHTCWEMLAAEKTKSYKPCLTTDFIHAALERLVRQQDPFYTQVWINLTAVQKQVLLAFIEKKGKNLLSAETVQKIGKGTSTVQKTLMILVERDILHTDETSGKIRYRFEDPFLAQWIRLFASEGTEFLV